MGFTIERVYSVSFEPCVGWPTNAEYSGLPDDLMMRIPVVNGHFESSLTGEMKLDNFTGYAIVEYCQERCTGCPEDRKAERKATLINYQKVWVAFAKYNAFAKYKEKIGSNKT